MAVLSSQVFFFYFFSINMGTNSNQISAALIDASLMNLIIVSVNE